MLKIRSRGDLKGYLMLGLPAIVIVLVLSFTLINNDHSVIKRHVVNNGATLTEIRRDNALMKDPFPLYQHGKNVRIYRYKYKLNDEEYTGWVKFGFKRDWRDEL